MTIQWDFAVPMGVIALMAVMILAGLWKFPDGMDGGNGLAITMALTATLWISVALLRRIYPHRRLLAALEAFALLDAVSLAAPLLAAVMAVGSGPYVDSWLVAADLAIFPFFDWQQMALELPRHRWAYALASQIYNTMFWQPPLLIAMLMLFGRISDQVEFVSAWCLALLLCILPYPWLPAQTPYIYYGITPEDMPGHDVLLPWTFYTVLEGLRDGTITALGAECLTGLVTIPSFHACTAVILTNGFWRIRLLRWPMLALNAAMTLVTVPIGGHYLIDVVIGLICGAVAVMTARRLGRMQARLSPTQACPPLPAFAAITSRSIRS